MSKYTKLKDKEIYKYDSVEGFTIYDPLSYRYNGFDIKSLYEHYLDKKHLKNTHNQLYIKLKDWLESNGLTSDKNNLYDLIDVIIDKVKIFKKGTSYHYVELDDYGYIKDYSIIKGDIIEDVDIPNDIKYGYYKLDGNKIIKDKEMEMKLWI